MSKAFEKLVRESREEMGQREVERIDWRAVDTKLFDQIDREQCAERARFVAGPAGRWAGLALAAAAAAVLIAVASGRGSEALFGTIATTDAQDSAGNVLRIDGEGALVDGKPAAQGMGLHLGDVIDARGGRIVVERPGKLTLVVERGTRTSVTHVQGGLVLALERGAVEAQVVPVASGEAFAVDVGASRVAVHGTHLRVERNGDSVVVDLNEGVVSVGEAPRVGSLLGALVTAPAHAEFSARAAVDTLTVTHAASAVRAPVELETTAQSHAESTAPVETSSPKVEGSGAHATTSGTNPGMHAENRAPNAAGQPAADANAEGTVAVAVRACMAERPPPENVTIEVSTTLRLELNDDGTVRAARFDPPVAPDVNMCAASSIYKTRFNHGGIATIPIDFQN